MATSQPTSGCYNLTDNGLGHAFVQEIGSLRALNLWSLCKQITDSSRIAQYLKGLEVLELGGCSNITNTGLLLIAWGLQRPKSLNLRSCCHLSDGHRAPGRHDAQRGRGLPGLSSSRCVDCQKLYGPVPGSTSPGTDGPEAPQPQLLRVMTPAFCTCRT